MLHKVKASCATNTFFRHICLSLFLFTFVFWRLLFVVYVRFFLHSLKMLKILQTHTKNNQKKPDFIVRNEIVNKETKERGRKKRDLQEKANTNYSLKRKEAHNLRVNSLPNLLSLSPISTNHCHAHFRRFSLNISKDYTKPKKFWKVQNFASFVYNLKNLPVFTWNLRVCAQSAISLSNSTPTSGISKSNFDNISFGW